MQRSRGVEIFQAVGSLRKLPNVSSDNVPGKVDTPTSRSLPTLGCLLTYSRIFPFFIQGIITERLILV